MVRKAKINSTEEVQKLTNSSLDTPDRFRLGELGYLGVKIFDGVSAEELKAELTYPEAVNTFKEMQYHSAISSALNLYEVLLSQAKYKVVPPEKATDKELEEAKFIKECLLEDMEGTFKDFVSDCLSAQVFGFAISEKVYRRRLKANGSKFNDGKIGIKKLSLRSQDTIEKFIFDDSGNEIIGVKQNLALVQNTYGRFSARKDLTVVLPKSKFLHVRVGRHRGDPYGKSPLIGVYFAYKYLTTVEDLEGQALAKDLVGVPMLKIPASYLATDASADKKAIADYFKNMLRNLQQGIQTGILLPSDSDENSKSPMFQFELVSADGKKLVDTEEIKKYYTNHILMSLMADVLLLGSSSTGSYALGSLKNNMVGAMCQYLLNNILQEVNQDLIKQIYELNGMDTSRMCHIDSDSVEEIPIEELSKAFQRAASVGMIELDRPMLNRVREMVGVDILPEDEEPQTDILTGNSSRAGDGMVTAGEGTATDPTESDTSSLNTENTA